MIPTFRPMMVRQRHPRLNDYLARFTALGGTMTGDRINALRTLFNGLWTDGLITGNATVGSTDILQYFNIFAAPVGSTIAQILEPPCRPTGVTGTNNGFVSGDLTSSGMVSSGTKNYIPGFTVSAVMQTNSAHFALYIKSFAASTGPRAIGADNTYAYYSRSSGNVDGGCSFHDFNQELYKDPASLSAPVFMVFSRNGATQEVDFNGSTKTKSSLNSTAPSTTDLICFGNIAAGDQPIVEAYTWESCGLGLNSTQKTALKNRIEAFNTAIGR